MKKRIYKKAAISVLSFVILFTTVLQTYAVSEGDIVSDDTAAIIEETSVSDNAYETDASYEDLEEAKPGTNPEVDDAYETDDTDEADAPGVSDNADDPEDADAADSAEDADTAEDADEAEADAEDDDAVPLAEEITPDTITYESATVSLEAYEQTGTEGDAITATAAFSVPDISVSKVKVYLYVSSGSSVSKKYVSVSRDAGSAVITVNLKKNQTHDVYAVLTDEKGNTLAESGHVSITTVRPEIQKGDISTTPAYLDTDNGTISVNTSENRLAYYKEGNGNDVKTVDGTTITGLKAGTYYVYIPAYADGDTYHIASGKVKAVVSSSDEYVTPEYFITTAGDDHVKWTKKEVSLKEGLSTSVYVHPVDPDLYLITGVEAVPSDNAKITYYPSTGEVFISEISGNIKLIAHSQEKPVATSIKVTGVDYNRSGIYSESNPYIQMSISIKALDQSGNPAPVAKVYFREDINGVSYTGSALTGEDGTATFKHSYGIGKGETSADYKPAFSFTSDFAQIKAQTDIHLILQRKADLVLYEDQITGTLPGENNGKVTGVPDNYELWDGVVHQGAISGEGKWIRPVNGEFTSLAAGQHVLRAGEQFDASTNTFRFASDYADFFIPRGLWTVRADTDASEHVVFTQGTEQAAEPGQTVYIYVEPEKGYEISEYYVDKPGYVSGEVTYSEENGYVSIEGISGSLALTVKAERKKKDSDTPSVIPDPNPSLPGNPDPESTSYPGTASDPEPYYAPAPAHASASSETLKSAYAQVPEQTVRTVIRTDAAQPAEQTADVAKTGNELKKTSDAVLKDTSEESDEKISIEDAPVALAGSVPVTGTDNSAASHTGIIIWSFALIIAAGGTIGYIYYKKRTNKGKA